MPEDEKPEENLENIVESYYAEDPQVGDMVFLKNNFEDCTIRGELVGVTRHTPQRGLSPEGDYEVVLYTGLDLRIAGWPMWLSLDEWEITDTLRGAEYKKLPPDVVVEKLIDEIDEEEDTNE